MASVECLLNFLCASTALTSDILKNVKSVESLLHVCEVVGLTAVKEPDSDDMHVVCTRTAPPAVYVVFDAVNNDVVHRRSLGGLLIETALRLKTERAHRRAIVASLVFCGSIKRDVQLTAAVKFLKTHKEDIDESMVSKAAGVGIDVSESDHISLVNEVMDNVREELTKKRYTMSVGLLYKQVLNKQPWADAKRVKELVDERILEILGPKTDADISAPRVKEKKPTPVKSLVTKASKEERDSLSVDTSGSKWGPQVAMLHAPGGNVRTDEYVVTPKTDSLIKHHLAATGGKVFTRFPPEPNGILHIGHAKAINFNFGYAREHGGVTYLRYDDTNPEAEEERFFTAISDAVSWLGFEPWKITHSSDHFDRLHALAVELIKRGGAYIDHQTPAEIYEERGGDPSNKQERRESPWRCRPVEESLKLFEDMRRGKVAEGAMSLRMKMDVASGNPWMWDPVAYRVKFCAHHRSGDTWCIYPTYDFTHCICDSLENISHSLCTTEFRTARESYYWLLNKLDLYCPVQWEYGRLNITGTVLSKRKILRLIREKIVSDWDDPRLYTLLGLRRRGFPPEAILNFCNKLGVSTASATTSVSLLEHTVRDYLNNTAPRCFVVARPLRIIIDGFRGVMKVTIPNLPLGPSTNDCDSHEVDLCSILYIERDDFSATPHAGFRRLTPNQPVGLKYANVIIRVKEILPNGDILVTSETATSENKPKAFIGWVSTSSANVEPTKAELRLYSSLFSDPNPEDQQKFPGGFITAVSPSSLEIADAAIIDSFAAKARPGDRYQFERMGYFVCDIDSESKGSHVFNLTVSLKEDKGK